MVDLAKDNQGSDILSRYIINMYDVATVASPGLKIPDVMCVITCRADHVWHVVWQNKSLPKLM